MSTIEPSSPGAADAEPRAPALRSVPRWMVVLAVAVAILAAAFTGFRVPSSWSATLDAVSLFDGFHRRFLVGTLLRPLATATGYNYWLFAAFSYLVLGAILAAVTVAAVREALFSRRVLVLAWLLLPAGGFLFHEVGYFDQVLYLLLFAAIWLLPRDRVWFAVGLMCAAPLVHEIAIATVIPVFGLVALRTLPVRRAVLVTLPPAVVNGVVLAVSPASPGAVTALTASLRGANFVHRSDALALFERSLAESSRLYSLKSAIVVVQPVAILLVVGFACVWLADRELWRRSPGRLPPQLGLLASCVAIAAPALLVYGGWDANRWAFMIIGNFFLVMWISLGDRRGHELGARAAVILATVVLLLGHVALGYFDSFAPRDLGSRAARRLLFREIKDRSLFKIPDL